MASKAKKVEVGFAGGQVVSLRLEEKGLGELRKRVERGDGWHDVETDDGAIAVDLTKVVFIRTAGGPHTIGFSGD